MAPGSSCTSNFPTDFNLTDFNLTGFNLTDLNSTVFNLAVFYNLTDFNLTVFNKITASNQCDDTRTSSTVKLKTVKKFEVHECPCTSEL